MWFDCKFEVSRTLLHVHHSTYFRSHPSLMAIFLAFAAACSALATFCPHCSRRINLLPSKNPSLRGIPWLPSGKVSRPDEIRDEINEFSLLICRDYPLIGKRHLKYEDYLAKEYWHRTSELCSKRGDKSKLYMTISLITEKKWNRGELPAPARLR